MKETRSQVNQEFPFRKPLKHITLGLGYLYNTITIASKGGKVVVYSCLIRKGACMEHLDYIYKG